MIIRAHFTQVSRLRRYAFTLVYAYKANEEGINVDEDFFPDDDDITYDNDPQSRNWKKDWRFKEYPEGFYYRCCEAKSNEPPCIVQRHIPAGGASAAAVKRSSSEGEEEDDEDEDEDE